jgi:hypothetical protein
MQKFTQENTSLLHKRIQEALNQVASELGVSSIKLGGYRWSDTSLSCSFEAKTGNPLEDKYLTSYCTNRLSFTKNVIGEKVKLRDKMKGVTEFTIYDIETKGRGKNRVKIRDAAGKTFVCTAVTIHNARPDLCSYRGQLVGKKFNF